MTPGRKTGDGDELPNNHNKDDNESENDESGDDEEDLSDNPVRTNVEESK